MNNSYWLKQSSTKPLFSDIEWSKPERRDAAGRLGIIGGNKLSFSSIAEAYSTALKTGVGEAKVLLPDALKKTIPASMTDVIFASTTPSGSLARDGLTDMLALGAWASSIVCAGDAGRNSETAIVYEDFIKSYEGQLVLTRDAIDLTRNNSEFLIERENAMFVMSFAQTQKLLQTVYYPKMLVFSMQLAQVVDVLHKFTLSYPATIVTFHQDQLIVAHNGNITTTPWNNPMAIWKGEVATRAAVYWLWNPTSPLEAATASFLA